MAEDRISRDVHYKISAAGAGQTAAEFGKVGKAIKDSAKQAREAAGKSGFGALKSTFGEESVLGNAAKMLRGAGAIAGLTIVANSVRDASKAAEEFSIKLRMGQASWREFVADLGSRLPVVGATAETLRSLREVITGEAAAMADTDRLLAKVATTKTAREKANDLFSVAPLLEMRSFRQRVEDQEELAKATTESAKAFTLLKQQARDAENELFKVYEARQKAMRAMVFPGSGFTKGAADMMSEALQHSLAYNLQTLDRQTRLQREQLGGRAFQEQGREVASGVLGAIGGFFGSQLNNIREMLASRDAGLRDRLSRVDTLRSLTTPAITDRGSGELTRARSSIDQGAVKRAEELQKELRANTAAQRKVAEMLRQLVAGSSGSGSSTLQLFPGWR